MRPPTIAPTLTLAPPSEGGGSFPSVLVDVLGSADEEGMETTPTWVRVVVEVIRTHVERTTVVVGVGVSTVTVRVRVPLTVVGITVRVRVEEDPVGGECDKFAVEY